MTSNSGLRHQLIDVSDCVLVVIDMQDFFLNRYEAGKSRAVVSNAVWLIRAAHALEVPIVAMAENIPESGPLNDTIANALPAGTPVHNKNFFGCGDQDEIFSAIKATGKSTAVLIGMETDVCVAHSALSLMAKGLQVAVVREILISTAADEDVGLMRIRDAGGVIYSVKSLYFEWLRSVSNWKALQAKDPDLEGPALPPTITL